MTTSRLSTCSCLMLLMLLSACYGPRRQQMLALLDEADSLNRAYAQLPSDSLLRDAADFFDRHGSPNEQLRAHYLLGCAYRDMGEAPQAIDCYLDAAAKADTTAADCDFCTLGCVYSQIADQYHRQLLLSNEIEARKQSHHYAVLANDTLGAITSIKLIAGAYLLKNKKDSAESLLKRALELYNNSDHEQDAVKASTMLMYLYTDCRDRLLDLKQLIDRYDAEYSLFDERHELPPTSLRVFYYYKGRYFEETDQLDSAEYYYRKIYRPNMSYVSLDPMYRGLLSVFQKRHQGDSIAKYAQLYCMVNDSSIAIKDQELTAQLSASYNYSLYQKAARTSEAKASFFRFWLLLTVFVAVIFISVVIYAIQQYRKKQREKQQEMKEKLNQHIDLYKQKMEELQQLKDLSEDYKEELALFKKMEGVQKSVLATIQQELSTAESDCEKYRKMYAQSRQDIAAVIADSEQKQKMLEKEIEGLKTETSSLKKEIDELSMNTKTSAWIEKSKLFADTPIFTRIKYVAEHPLEQVQESEWDELTVVFSEHFPALYHDISQHQDKNKQLRCRICILTVMGIRNGEQACLLDKPKQTITNNMSALNRMLFGDDSSRTLYKNLVNGYNICL